MVILFFTGANDVPGSKDLAKFSALDIRGQEHDSKFFPFETIEQDSGRDLSQLFSKALHDLDKARASSNRHLHALQAHLRIVQRYPK